VYTPGYEAPEVVGKQRYATEMDIWMLGCSLLEMLTGQAPFYYAAHLPPEERAARRQGSELTNGRSPYSNPTHEHYNHVGRHLTPAEREALQRLLEPDTRHRVLLHEVVALPYFMWGPAGKPPRPTVKC
jgi:serine/threonine protein kinase